jgi:hypothetical protein
MSDDPKDWDEKTVITAANAVVNISTSALSAEFVKVFGLARKWEGEERAQMEFLCDRLADVALDYFVSVVQAGEKKQ